MTSATPNDSTFSIELNRGQKGYFDAKLAKFNRRAAKLGFPQAVAEITREWTRELRERRDPHTNEIVRDPHTDEIVRRIPMIEITVTAEVLRIEGYEFIATIEPLGDENVISGAPTAIVEAPDHFRHAKLDCAHCRTARARKNTFILRREEDGEFLMIGRNCLADYIGHDPKQRLQVWKALDALADDEEYGREPGSRGDRTIDLLDALYWTARAIGEDGWVSRTVAHDRGGAATADVAMKYLFHGPDRKLGDNPPALTPEWKAEVEAAIEWAQTCDTTNGNSYLQNIAAIARAGYFTGRLAGFACSILPTYRRHLQGEIERKERAAQDAESQHFGEPKQRAEFTLRVLYMNWIEGDYGVRTMILFKDEAGNVAKWWASGDRSDFEKGHTYRVKATVKGHETYKGRNETVLQRVAVLEDLGGENGDDSGEEAAA